MVAENTGPQSLSKPRAAVLRRRPAKAKPKAGPQPLSLALQGGGAHGAFTWGVLDRLLEDERIAVEAISATSAGAMNAAVFAQGLMVQNRQRWLLGVRATGKLKTPPGPPRKDFLTPS